MNNPLETVEIAAHAPTTAPEGRAWGRGLQCSTQARSQMQGVRVGVLVPCVATYQTWESRELRTRRQLG